LSRQSGCDLLVVADAVLGLVRGGLEAVEAQVEAEARDLAGGLAGLRDPHVGRRLAAGEEVDAPADGEGGGGGGAGERGHDADVADEEARVPQLHREAQRRGRDDRRAEQRHQQRERHAVEDVVEAQRDDELAHRAVALDVETGRLHLEDERAEHRHDGEDEQERRDEAERRDGLPQPARDHVGEADDHHADEEGGGDERHPARRQPHLEDDAGEERARDEIGGEPDLAVGDRGRGGRRHGRGRGRGRVHD
jgi:hypothetical protein